MGQQSDVEVVGEVSAENELFGVVRALCPNRVLVDVRMPGSSGLEIGRQIRAIDPELGVVILSVYADQLKEALRAGASHYLLKGYPAADMIRALQNPCWERPCTRRALVGQGTL